MGGPGTDTGLHYCCNCGADRPPAHCAGVTCAGCGELWGDVKSLAPPPACAKQHPQATPPLWARVPRVEALRLRSVVCEGWGVAAAPGANARLRDLPAPPDTSVVGTFVGVVLLVALVVLADGNVGYVGAPQSSATSARKRAEQAAAGKVVYRLRVTFAGGQTTIVSHGDIALKHLSKHVFFPSCLSSSGGAQIVPRCHAHEAAAD